MIKASLFTLPLAALGMAQMASAAVTTSTSAPTIDILSSKDAGVTGIDTALIDEAANDNHARGQLFSLGAAGGVYDTFLVTAITVKKSNSQTYVNDTITLRLFEGTEAQWTSGTGHSTADDGANYYVGTTVAPLYTETFTLNGAIANNDFVTFKLATPLTIDESSDFGFFMTYDQVGGTQDRFRHRENSTGGRIAITTTDHSDASSRNIVYYVQGVVPEPSAALLGTLGLLGLLRRRRH